MTRLEIEFEHVRKDLDAINGKLDGLVKDVAYIRGRIEHTPTTIQLITLVFLILGGAFAILRFGLPAVQ